MTESLAEFYAGALTALLTVPNRIRHHRSRRAISLRTAAEEMGIGFNTLTRIECGGNYTEDTLRAVLCWLIEQEKDTLVIAP